MGFNTNVKKFKDFKEADVKNYWSANQNRDESLDRSYNCNHSKIDNSIRVIIVGTYTPIKGRENGYYYSAPKNSMYEILDTYFKVSNFVNLKNDLLLSPKDKIVIDKIKAELRKRHISLLDVLDYAVSSNTSASDDKITCFNLDYNTFKNIPENVVFVANSRNAEKALKQIKKVNDLKNTIDYAPQILWKKKDIKQKRWDDVLQKYL